MCVMKLPILVLVAQSALAATCADLSSLHPRNTAITLAQTVEAGAFTPPAGPGRGPKRLQNAAGLLSRGGDADAQFGFGHQNLAAGGELEREVSGSR